jgi:hypothetical protein
MQQFGSAPPKMKKTSAAITDGAANSTGRGNVGNQREINIEVA